MVELKARVSALAPVRRRIHDLGALHIGTFRQTDVYFKVPEGRLKLRQVEGKNTAELIYYERKNVADPKRSNVFILEIQNPASLNNVLEKILETRVTVEKSREIYQYQGTQIHVDTVKGLGVFVELERTTSSKTKAIEKDQQTLEELRKKLGIEREDFCRLSYGELIKKPNME
ncbi:MAG: class IV adenylate cyclase [Candidatus Bathyarchaeota archaeon]|nr:MAG: class IV adenylate cyclase [Candidatus Bathyarchaeota archaeon]